MKTTLLSVLLLAGCFSPRANPSRYYLLTSQGDTLASPAPLPVTLGIGPVTIPRYLDRSQVITRVSEHEISVSEWDLWAEPLSINFARSLEENLALMLQPTRIVSFPWYQTTPVDFAVAIEAVRFEADSTARAFLEVRWTIRDARSDERIAGATSTIEEPPQGTDTEAAVAALSRALGRLSRDIADEVRRVANR